jgi:transcriptional regulator with XRE-family HTH domain
MNVLTPFERQRLSLGERLRDLRRRAGLGQTYVASQLAISQAKLSRIETGHLIPSDDEVQKLAQLFDVGTTVEADLLELAEYVRTEVNAWRTLFRPGFWWNQSRIADLEAKTNLSRCFQMAVIPGLLQTEAYARAAHVLFDPGLADSADDIAKSRRNRQEILSDITKQFDFIITEGALRARVASDNVMRLQLHRVIDMVAYERVSIGVLPSDARLKAVPICSFTIYDDEFVTLETLTTEVSIRDPRDVQRYVKAFDALRESAYFGSKMTDLVNEIARGLPSAATAEDPTEEDANSRVLTASRRD